MKNILATAVFTLCLSMLWVSAQAASGPVRVNIDVPPGEWKGVRLRNLPKDAVVAVEVEASGEILVALVDTSNYLRYPDTTRSLFLGRVEKRLSFSVSIRAAGDHYLMFDNRSKREPQAITATIHAARSGANQIEAADKILSDFERQLHRIFVFDPFPIRVEQCGVPKAFSGSSGIVLCAEYIRKLYETVGERERAKDTLSFTIFHEVGEVLLSQWKYPFFDDHEMAAEFASVLLVMLNQKEEVIATAEYFVKNPLASEAIGKLFPINRHPFSVQLARKILRWLKDPQFALKWQKVLVPHMQTPLLKKLRQQPTSWTDLELVKKELATRQHGVPEDTTRVPRPMSSPVSNPDHPVSRI